MAFGHLICPGFHLFGLNLHGLATPPTNQVVVVPLATIPIQKLPVSRLQGVGLAGRHQFIQGPINGGQTNTRTVVF